MSPDDPTRLAELVAGLPRPLLLAVDVDGVLAPLVAHPDQSRLTPRVATALTTLAERAEVHVAVVSGRSLDGLAHFGFASTIAVVGSHGAESSGRPPPALSPAETTRLTELSALAEQAAVSAGRGAWVEHKPASVVLHVRGAEPGPADIATTTLCSAATGVHGAMIKPGHAVVELMARHTDKGRAVGELRRRFDPRSVVFVGDDVTDEDGFHALGDGDVGIKVGDGATAATRRLSDTDAVRDWLVTLVDAMDNRPR
jgi:trehalose-phosphatase